MEQDFKLDTSKLPNHIAMICDGNRRWARKNGYSDFTGHRKGFEAAWKLAKDVRKLGVKHLTYWFFSTENWTRSKPEVAYLMKFAIAKMKMVAKDVLKDKVHFKHIGRKDRLPAKLIEAFKDLEEKTKKYTKYYLNLALDHGGRDEIVRGVKEIIKQGIDIESLSEDNFGNFLDTAEMPDVDLLIRTSGEQRTSGFLTWKSVYAELAFPRVALPDFNINELKKILLDYQNRDRRFGGDSKKEDEEYRMVRKA